MWLRIVHTETGAPDWVAWMNRSYPHKGDIVVVVTPTREGNMDYFSFEAEQEILAVASNGTTAAWSRNPAARSMAQLLAWNQVGVVPLDDEATIEWLKILKEVSNGR